MNVTERGKNGMKGKDGFTLIELLAVIVILSVIALIATPLVLNMIERAEKGAFKDSVYGIMEAAEFQVILDDLKYPITFVYPLDSERIQFKGTKPTEGYIQVVDEGKMKLALGNGRWCATKGVNESQVTIKNGKCEIIDFNRPIISGYGDLNQEIDLNASYALPNVIATDKDGNQLNVITTIKQGDKIVDHLDTSKVGSYTITYTTEPDSEGNTSSVTITIKVVKKETDTDKIIESGVKDGGLDLIDGTYYYRGSSPNNWVQFDGVTGDDSLWRIISIENGLLKIVRPTSVANIMWDEVSNSNSWTRPASINTYLNETYKPSLPLEIKNQIQSAPFYIGTTSIDIYDNSKSPITVAQIKENERKTAWTGDIGLINMSDYGYATTKENMTCANDVTSINCRNDNWIYSFILSANTWTMNANSNYSDGIFCILTGGSTNANCTSDYAAGGRNTFPVIHLKSNVKIIAGDGSKELPFVIGK